MNPLIIVFIGGLAMIVVLIGILSAIGMSRINRYRQDIIFIETCITHWIITRSNYTTLLRLFTDIRRNDQDPKRTDLAWIRFIDKFSNFYYYGEDPVKKEAFETIKN